MGELSGRTAVVVGASRGLGRGVAEAFVAAGATTVALARDTAPLARLAAERSLLTLEPGDATDPATAERLLERHRPDVLALVAGATPLMRPLHEHTWESFSVNWATDVRMTFAWLRAALLLPLRSGSRVIVTSSGAALKGSVLSGGYAGAKATQRFLADYAAEEAGRAGLGIAVAAVLPQLTPATDLGRPAVAAYAQRAGVPVEQFLAPFGRLVSPEVAGAAFVELAAGRREDGAGAYLLTGDGLRPLP
ncbi:MAG: SDR family NAD(P)-dependent oxidoreductase [Frankiaceae bacterium]